MRTDELKGGHARVVIVGCGVTGASVARHLARAGIDFDVADGAPDRRARALERALGAHAPDRRSRSARSTRRSRARWTPLPRRARFGDDSLDAVADEGHDVIVLSPGIPRAHPAVRAALARGARVIGDVELFAGAVDAPVVAVTGSNGKSTVVAWLAHALRAAGVDARACGNIGAAALDALVEAAAPPTRTAAPGEGAGGRARLRARAVELPAGVHRVPRAARRRGAQRQRRPPRPLRLDRRLRAPSSAACTAARARIGRERRRRAHPAGGRRADALLRGREPARWRATRAPPALERRGALAPGRERPGARPDALHRDGRRRCWRCRRCARRGGTTRERARGARARRARAAALGRDETATRADLLAGLGDWAGLAHRTELVHEAGGVRWYDDSKGTNVDACARALEAMPGPVVLIMGGLAKGADFRPARAARRRARAPAAADRARPRGSIARALEGAAPHARVRDPGGRGRHGGRAPPRPRRRGAAVAGLRELRHVLRNFEERGRCASRPRRARRRRHERRPRCSGAAPRGQRAGRRTDGRPARHRRRALRRPGAARGGHRAGAVRRGDDRLGLGRLLGGPLRGPVPLRDAPAGLSRRSARWPGVFLYRLPLALWEKYGPWMIIVSLVALALVLIPGHRARGQRQPAGGSTWA